MTNEEKVVGSSLQSAKPTPKSDISAEDVPEYFGREFGYIQQRVPAAFELDDGHLVPSDMSLRILDGPHVDFVAQPNLQLGQIEVFSW